MPFFGLWLSVVLLTVIACAVTDPMRTAGVTLGALVLIAVVVAISRKVSDN